MALSVSIYSPPYGDIVPENDYWAADVQIGFTATSDLYASGGIDIINGSTTLTNLNSATRGQITRVQRMLFLHIASGLTAVATETDAAGTTHDRHPIPVWDAATQKLQFFWPGYTVVGSNTGTYNDVPYAEMTNGTVIGATNSAALLLRVRVHSSPRF